MRDEKVNTRTAKKGIALETTLCSNGVINCWSTLGSGKAHSIHVDERGRIEKCTCKGWTHHGHCYHTDTIRENRPLLSAARACSDTKQVASDGGLPEITHHVEEPQYGGETYVRCTGCGVESIGGPNHILHDDDCPRSNRDRTPKDYSDVEFRGRTEKADFGGGESTGIDKL